MAAETETIHTIDHKPHAAFFRQSGWLTLTGIAGGVLTLGVHFLNKRIPDSEYSNFGALLMVTACIPTLPLQMVMAQQCAQALASNRERQLSGMIRLGWLWTFLIWAVAAVVVLMFQSRIVERWQLPNASGLWITLVVVLISLWMPFFGGVLQGRQDFFWLGWAAFLNGLARVAVAAVLVLALNGGATSMMVGTLFGIGVAGIIAMWRTRDLWTLPTERFDVKPFLSQVVPLTFGFGAFQFFFTSDTMFARAFFDGDEMKPYVAAGTLARSLLWLVLPMAAVMFPKLVHSHAKSEKTNLLGIVLIGTLVVALGCMVGLWLIGPWVVRFVYKTGDVNTTMALIPWYAAAMVPLALSNVLVNHLMARACYKAVPAMVLLAVVYGFTLPQMLHHYPGKLTVVLQTLAVFNLLLFAVCGWFTLREKGTAPRPAF